MKYFTVIILLFSTFTAASAQQIVPCPNCNACESCEDSLNTIQSQYLARYSLTPDQQNAIKNNWSEFFFEDLERILPANTSESHSIPLKFDSFGCIYPNFMDNKWAHFFKINESIHEKEMDKNTFYAITYRTKKRRHYNPDAFYDAFPSTYRTHLETLIKTPMPNRNAEDIAKSDFEYIKQWNGIFVPEQIQLIKETVERKGIKKIVTLIHGYGVPYSLAQIQFNNLIDLYAKKINDSLDLKKILFLKVFWPSGDFKKYSIQQNGLTFENVKNFKVVRHVTYKTTRVFMVAAQLRKILTELNFDGEFQLIGHSSGSVLASATIVNPIQKLNLTTNNTPINKHIDTLYRVNNPPPTNYTKLLLNASSMPGRATFGSDLDESTHRNVYWTIGFNNTDRALQKMILRHTRFRNVFGNSTLGANMDNEIDSLQKCLRLKKPAISKNFTFVEMGKQKDKFGHDFFCYLNQECFVNAFKKFINQ